MRTEANYPRMWLDYLDKYVVKGTLEERQKFSKRVVRYLGDKAMLEVVREWWTACR
jgi:hypothetical protein